MVLNLQAEIIPDEPDAGNAVVGKSGKTKNKRPPISCYVEPKENKNNEIFSIGSSNVAQCIHVCTKSTQWSNFRR